MAVNLLFRMLRLPFFGQYICILAVNKELWKTMDDRQKVFGDLFKSNMTKAVQTMYATNCKAITDEGKTLAGKTGRPYHRHGVYCIDWRLLSDCCCDWR